MCALCARDLGAHRLWKARSEPPASRRPGPQAGPALQPRALLPRCPARTWFRTPLEVLRSLSAERRVSGRRVGPGTPHPEGVRPAEFPVSLPLCQAAHVELAARIAGRELRTSSEPKLRAGSPSRASATERTHRR
jgi:hypothetical protein